MTNKLAGLAKVRHLTLILSCCMLAVFSLLWFIIPARPVFAGFFIGGSISLYNVLHLARRVRIAGESVISGTPRLMGTGLISRMLMVAFGVLLAFRFPEWIDGRFLALGLLMSYVLMVVAACICAKNESKKKEGRINFWKSLRIFTF